MLMAMGKRAAANHRDEAIKRALRRHRPNVEEANMLMGKGKRSLKRLGPNVEDASMLMGMGKRSNGPNVEDASMLMGMGKRSQLRTNVEDAGMLMGMGKRSWNLEVPFADILRLLRDGGYSEET